MTLFYYGFIFWKSVFEKSSNIKKTRVFIFVNEISFLVRHVTKLAMKLHHVTIVDTVVDEVPSFHFALATLTLKVMVGTISEMTIQFSHRLS